MANASVIGRPERTPSLGYTKDRKRFTDFGASARRADGQPDGGDMLKLRVRVNAGRDGMEQVCNDAPDCAAIDRGSHTYPGKRGVLWRAAPTMGPGVHEPSWVGTLSPVA